MKWELIRFNDELPAAGQLRGTYKYKWQAKRERRKYMLAQLRGELWLVRPLTGR